MTNPIKFRVQAGNLVFEMEGEREFVEQQMNLHRDHIDLILSEQAKIIKSGKLSGAGRRRGRPAGAQAGTRLAGDRRPGRQPVIIRQSELKLKPRQLSRLVKFLATVGGGAQLGKDATVFAVAYILCTEVLGSDTFTAGDVSAAIAELGENPTIPPADTIDVVQMLRNLAAASIGKEWVARNNDGTFCLTEKGKEAGSSGGIIRPRGRRPAASNESPKNDTEQNGGRRGQPHKKG